MNIKDKKEDIEENVNESNDKKDEEYFILEADSDWTNRYKEGDIITIDNGVASIGNEKYKIEQVDVIGSDLIVNYNETEKKIDAIGTNTKRFVIKGGL